MVQALDETIQGDGHIEEETQEQLEAVHKRLKDLVRPDGSLVSFGKAELSLMQKILSTGSETYREEQMWRMCRFSDRDEALDHVAAYYEAKELGMDTSFNVAYAFAIVSVEERGSGNLLTQILDALQHAKWAQSDQTKNRRNNGNSRSPLDGD